MLWQRQLRCAVAAGGSSQRRSQRQQGKTPAAADKGKDCEYVTMPGERRGVGVVAGEAGGEARGGGAAPGRRYDESEGVYLKVTMASS